MQRGRTGRASDWRMTETMGMTKDYSRVLRWLFSLLLLNLHFLPVTPQGNMTETATNITVTTSSLETNYSTDAIMTSLGSETTTVTTEFQTERATEIITEIPNATTLKEVNATTESSGNSTEIIMPITDAPVNPTTESSENATEIVTFWENLTEIVTELVTITEESTENQTEIATEVMTLPEESTGSSNDDGGSLPVNITTVSSLSTAVGQTTLLPSTSVLPNPSKLPTDFTPSFILPIVIFIVLLFLLIIMIFIAVLTKSRMKRSISTYNLTPAANGTSSQIGYRNTAYDQGDVADDTDVECSMTEIRLEGKPTNGTTLHDIGEFEEELTPL